MVDTRRTPEADLPAPENRAEDVARLDTARAQRAQAVLRTVLGRPAEQRPALLDLICANDPELHAEVAGLLARHSGPVPAGPEASTGGLARPLAGVPSFAPAEVLAGRFRVERLLGRGGMGEVYAAFDQEVRETVALKTLLPERAHDERAIERLRRELHLARRVTHPSVCRLHDLFRHQGPRGDVLFVTMQYLEGETLSARIDRGPLPAAEALPLAREMAEALAAAHTAGVVHRDFKSGNVLLVPGPDGRSHAVVTDFGLARSGPSDGFTSVSGELLGTPLYMAPEQLSGREATAASDVYGFGVTLYEMLTGRLPLQGETAFATAARRLTEATPSPRDSVPDLSRAWEVLVLRCLERDPGRRFGSAQELLAAMAGTADGAARPLQQRAALVALALTAALAGILAGRAGGPGPAVPLASVVPQASARRSLAVLAFRNASGQPQLAWLGPALAELVASELGANHELRLLPGEEVTRASRELGLPASDQLPAESLLRLRARLGAELLALGSFVALPGAGSGQLRLDVRVIDAAGGQPLFAHVESGRVDDVFGLVARAGVALRAQLGVAPLTSGQAQALSTARPSGAEALRLYAEGLDRLRLADAAGARERLLASVQADPAFPLAHSALATAWASLGHDAQASASARRALELAAGLPREDRLLVEARAHEARKDWARAAELYRALYTFFPDVLEHGLRAAEAQVFAGDVKKARELARTLRRQAPADPRVDLLDAEVQEALGDYRAAQAAAAQAAGRAEAQGALLLEARARLFEGDEWHSLSDPGRARAAYKQARDFYQRFGSEELLARAVFRLGLVQHDLSDLEGARLLYEQALATWQRTGDRRGLAVALSNLAILDRTQGRLSRALQRYRQAQSLAREAADRPGGARVAANLANVLLELGRLPEAEHLLQGSRREMADIGNPGGVASARASLGELSLLRGDPAAALREVEGELGAARERGDSYLLATLLSVKARALLASGQASAARPLAEEVQRLHQAGQRRTEGAEAGTLLARVAVATGEREEALRLVRAAWPELQRAGALVAQAEARAVEAEALLALGRSDEARQAAEAALQLVGGTENVTARRPIELLLARVARLKSLAPGASGQATPPAP